MMKQNWIYKKLGDVATIKSGKSIGADQIFNFDTSMYPCYGGNGLRGYVQTYNNEGDMPIIGRVGALCGNVHLSHGKFYATEHALVVKILSNNILAEWLTYCLKSLNLRRIAKGVAQPVIAASEVANISIPVPPLPLQQSIVAELDNISNLIDVKNLQLKDYNNLAQSIFCEMFGDPVENEKGWEEKKLGDVCDVRDGTHDSPVYQEDGYPLVTSKNVIDGKISFEQINYISKEDFDRISKRSKVDDGDIIMPMIGTIGNPTIVKKEREFAIKNVALIKFKSESSVINIYIQAVMSSAAFNTYMKRCNKGGTQKFIALGDIRNLPIPLPPLALQQKFAEKIEAIEKHKQIVNVTIKDLETLLASRMQFWFE